MSGRVNWRQRQVTPFEFSKKNIIHQRNILAIDDWLSCTVETKLRHTIDITEMNRLDSGDPWVCFLKTRCVVRILIHFNDGASFNSITISRGQVSEGA